MAAIGSAPSSARQTFFLNDPKIRGVFYQIVVAVVVVGFAVWIIQNTAVNLAAQNKTTGFDFLWKTSGFDISFSLFPFDRSSYYYEAFLVGLTNTILVAVIGIAAATIIGFTLGIARLSSNFIVSRLATIYIETIRNIPLLLQLFFWYFAVLKAMPAVRNSLALPFDIFINQRGLFVPRPIFDQGFIWVAVALLVGIVGTIVLRNWVNRVRETTGIVPQPVAIAAMATNVVVGFAVSFALLAVAGYALLPFDLGALAPGAVIFLLVLGIAMALAAAILSQTRFRPFTLALQTFLLAAVVASYIAAYFLAFLPFDVSRIIGVAVGGVAAWFTYTNAMLGRRAGLVEHFPASLGIVIILALPVIAYLLSGSSLTFDPPVLQRFNFRGGLELPPEFVALAWGLTIYTAAFIAETVRAGILAVSHGQTEAAQSLGLKDNDRLRLVIVPQAMRVIVPPLTSQYLNLTKNSSLGAAIGYPELVNVWAGTALNQTGRAIECIAMAMAVYLCLSLLTSAIMNWYNARVALVER